MSSDLDCRAPHACANLVPIPRALKNYMEPPYGGILVCTCVFRIKAETALVSYAAVFSGVTQRSPHKRLLKTEPHSFPDL